MDFWLIAYIVTTIVVGSGLVSWLYKRGQNMGAILLLVLLILVFAFYGLRWFPGGNLNGTQAASGTAWPPIINMCPDFMSSWTDPVTKRVYCYDGSNTYGLKTYAGAGLTTGLTINNVPGQSAYLIKDPARNTNAVSLRDDPNGARWPFLFLLKTNPTLILGDSNGKYMRWEGVVDGAQIDVNRAPLP
jgi:hypothetical protein